MVFKQINFFTVWDYLILAVLLIISLAIGIYHGHKASKKKDPSAFVTGIHSMGVLPVSLSLIAGIQSSIGILGVTAEIYTQGAQFFLQIIGSFFCIVFAAHFYIPVLYNLNISNVYEYFEIRFNSKILHHLSSVNFVILTVIWASIVLYAPSLALSTVTGISISVIFVVTTIVVSTYTALGGVRGVIWADVFQLVIMWVGFLVVLVEGFKCTGGLSRVLQISKNYGRLEMLNFNPNPFMHYNFWSLAIGGTLTWLTTYIGVQTQVQRLLSVKSQRKAQLTLYLNIPGWIIMYGFTVLTGLMAFTYYYTCDPFKAKVIKSKDQIVPYFIMEIMSSSPGLPGLFVSSIVSASLSTLSSGLNALSSVTWSDLHNQLRILQTMKESQKIIFVKILAFFYGGVCLCLVFIISAFPAGILQLIMYVNGFLMGPVLGAITLGILFPWANAKGTLIGFIITIIIFFWISIGTIITQSYRISLPTSIEGCPPEILNITLGFLSNSSANFSASSNLPPYDRYGLTYLYQLSSTWYGGFTFAITIILGLIFSFIIGPSSFEDVDPKTISPWFDYLFFYLPEKKRYFFSFKRQQMLEEELELKNYTNKR